MRFLFTCGGTAGHINPALALADEIKRTIPGVRILFVGSGRSLENRLIPQAGYEIKNIRISGFERSLTPSMIIRNLRNLRNLASASAQSSEIIRMFKPDAAIGTGGYVCYPVLRKAAQLGVPTVVHESNAVPGLTTKMLEKSVDRILVAYPDIADQYRYPKKVIFTGTPVRGAFLLQTKQAARMALGVDGRPLVVSFWGSLGADVMNDIIADFIAFNLESRMFNHIHATGGGEVMAAALKKRLHDRMSLDVIPRWIDIRAYIDDMPSVMAASDLILCRGGASTLAELAFMAKPAVIVPSPNVTNNHQEKNAQQLRKLGGAVVIDEKTCTGELLYKTVGDLLMNKPKLAAMSDAMKKAAVQDSAARIIDLILSMCT
jgi:UDP-N-acetylglucosamine--N-acetylmuramyl-(pentapeptide) pyrophosphoryl-undecaprenol N-acetylglucosamine transferase